MMPYKHILEITFVVVFVVVSGCNTFLGQSNETTEPNHQVFLNNQHNDTHAVTVEIYKDSGQVQTYSDVIQPGTDWEIVQQNAGGNYTIVASLNESDRVDTEYELPLVDGDRRSYTMITINRSGMLEMETGWED